MLPLDAIRNALRIDKRIYRAIGTRSIWIASKHRARRYIFASGDLTIQDLRGNATDVVGDIGRRTGTDARDAGELPVVDDRLGNCVVKSFHMIREARDVVEIIDRERLRAIRPSGHRQHVPRVCEMILAHPALLTKCTQRHTAMSLHAGLPILAASCNCRSHVQSVPPLYPGVGGMFTSKFVVPSNFGVTVRS